MSTTTTKLSLKKHELTDLWSTIIADQNANMDKLDTEVGLLEAPPAARVYHDAAQSIADSAETALAFNQERFDTDTMHDTATNNSRIKATTAGKYVISANVQFASNSTGHRSLMIRLNGATRIAYLRVPAVSGAVTILSVSTVYNLAANDYVEALVVQTSGGALNVEVNGNVSPEFMAIRVGD